MSEDDRIRQVLYDFINAGLVEKDVEKLLRCISKQIIGIGLGEQGFVTSLQDVRNVFETSLKTDDPSHHSVQYGRVELLHPCEHFAVICAEVHVHSHPPDEGARVIKTQFQQSLSLICEEGVWRICGLHATTPIMTEEDLEAYPLKLAEKTLVNLREKIGEEVYLAEEQYRKAVLADSIAFYIINFSANCFEQCHLQNNICVYVEPNTPFEGFLQEKSTDFVFAEDIAEFITCMSLKSIEKAFQTQTNEVFCEYRMRYPDGSYVWTRTVIRLITDVVSGDRKGIMYVKNIDEDKRAVQRIMEKADYDSMTMLLNKGAMIRQVSKLLQQDEPSAKGSFLMVDVDNFKYVNDSFGHPMGDQVLITIAAILQNSFGHDSKIGRLGGDEFGVFLLGRLIDETLHEQVDQLLLRVSQLVIPEAPALTLSVSVGCAQLLSRHFEDYYREADKALYQAKHSGKNAAIFRSSSAP